MTLYPQKETKQGKIGRFLTSIIENSAFAIFTRYEIFSSRNTYHKAKAPISTVLFYTMPHVMTQRHEIEQKMST